MDSCLPTQPWSGGLSVPFQKAFHPLIHSFSQCKCTSFKHYAESKKRSGLVVR